MNFMLIYYSRKYPNLFLPGESLCMDVHPSDAAVI